MFNVACRCIICGWLFVADVERWLKCPKCGATNIAILTKQLDEC